MIYLPLFFFIFLSAWRCSSFGRDVDDGLPRQQRRVGCGRYVILLKTAGRRRRPRCVYVIFQHLPHASLTLLLLLHPLPLLLLACVCVRVCVCVCAVYHYLSGKPLIFQDWSGMQITYTECARKRQQRHLPTDMLPLLLSPYFPLRLFFLGWLEGLGREFPS